MKQTKPPDSILVFQLSGAGDAVLTTPFLKALRAACPEARIDILAMSPEVRDLVQDNPHIDRVRFFNFIEAGYLKSLFHCLKLRRERYDCCIAPMPNHRLEHNVIAGLIGARHRIGFSYVMNSGAFPRWFFHTIIPEKNDLHIVDNNLRLLPEALDLPVPDLQYRLEVFRHEEDRQRAAAFLELTQELKPSRDNRRGFFE
ncbi:MAG: glycosyltransferase family 9 protein, partial [Verrucomicrobiota bacterium]